MEVFVGNIGEAKRLDLGSQSEVVVRTAAVIMAMVMTVMIGAGIRRSCDNNNSGGGGDGGGGGYAGN